MPDAQYKVLFVDDDEFLLNMYQLKAKKVGIDSTVIAGSVKAIEKLKEGYRPDALVVDILMPVMDGFEFVESVRKEKLAEGAAIILLTNQGSDEDIARAKKLGVDGYVVKASNIPSEVLAEIIKILKARKK